jgi:hypothetical protein
MAAGANVVVASCWQWCVVPFVVVVVFHSTHVASKKLSFVQLNKRR